MERIRSLFRRSLLILLPFAAFLFTGCATSSGQRVGPTTMMVAMEPYPSEELLNIGVEVFEEGQTDTKAMEKQNTGDWNWRVAAAQRDI